jgi:hypothetical protein
VNTGPVHRFWDRFGAPGNKSAGRWNYVGEGITEGERVLTAIGKDKEDVIFISAKTRTIILGDYLRDQNSPHNATRWLQNRGRQRDKHGKFRSVYEINHTGWMAEYSPDPAKLPPVAGVGTRDA